MFGISSLCQAREYTLGQPEGVTVTATTVTTSWTKLLDSDVSCGIWRISERSMTMVLQWTYNSLTWTVIDDYQTLPANTDYASRRSIPNGVFVKASDTAKVEFESLK